MTILKIGAFAFSDGTLKLAGQPRIPRFSKTPEGASIVPKWSLFCRCGLLALLLLVVSAPANASGLDDVLNRENSELGIGLKPAPIANDLVFLRRVTVDLIGRIPTEGQPGWSVVIAWKTCWPVIGFQTAGRHFLPTCCVCDRMPRADRL